VPYLIAAPGLINDPVRISRVASLIDTPPTILDLLGLESPATFEGISLLEPAPTVALFFTDYSLGLLGLRDSCWKFIHQVDNGASKLFDVCKDPDELQNLAPRMRNEWPAIDRVLKRGSGIVLRRSAVDGFQRETEHHAGRVRL